MLKSLRPDPHALAAFVVGAGVMAVELTASRLLAPVYGAGLYVWTSIICTVLLAMSFGYRFGGALSTRGGTLKEVGWLLVGAALTSLLGLGILTVFGQAAAISVLSFSSARVTMFFGSLLTATVAFAAPVFVLAASSPLILKSWIGAGDAGEVSGRYFMVSTIGSVIGTIAPTLWLVPTFGARLTIGIAAAAFLATGLTLIPARRRLAVTAIVIVAAAAVLLPQAKRNPNVVVEVESPYQLIKVVTDGSKRMLKFNEGYATQTVYDPSTAFTGLYYDYLSLVPNLRPPEEGPMRVAILGLAGGSAARSMLIAAPPGVLPSIVGVEVDPKVIDVAYDHFDLDRLPIEVKVMDARMFLAASQDKYDAILVDAYGTQLYIPPHMATTEFFALVRSRLNPGGVMLSNINAPSVTSPLFVALTNTVAASFPVVRDIPITGGWNHLILASDTEIPFQKAVDRTPKAWTQRISLTKVNKIAYDPAKAVLTDDRAPVELLTDTMVYKAMMGHKE